MAKYVLAYHGGAPAESGADGKEIMDAWMAWFGGLGSAVVEMGAPVGAAVTVNPDGSTTEHGGANPITGYSVVAADDLANAVEIARGCPHLAAGGTIEVAEAVEM